MWVKRLALGAVVAVVGSFLLTFVGLESGGVAVVTTQRADGAARETHVWFAEIDGELWLEAGTPENGWFVDVQKNPRSTLALPSGAPARYIARPDASVEAQRAVREALHAKYRWRDTWVGLLIDESRSVAVRLDPSP